MLMPTTARVDCWSNPTLCSVQLLQGPLLAMLRFFKQAGSPGVQSHKCSAEPTAATRSVELFCVWLLMAAAAAPGCSCLLLWAVAHLALLDARQVHLQAGHGQHISSSLQT